MPRPMIPARERFEAKVDRSGGPDACHPWTGSVFKQTGYGVFHPVKGVTTTAHRWLYIQENGDPGPSVVVDHLCHNVDPECPGGPTCRHRCCQNPRHHAAKPTGENQRASLRSNHRKMRCPAGHAYTPANTRVQRGPYGERRSCRECERVRDKERAPRRRASKETTGGRI